MNKKLLLTLPLAVSLLALTACWEDSSSADAQQTEAQVEQSQTMEATAEISAEAMSENAESAITTTAIAQEGITGIYCHKTEDYNNSLVAVENPNEGKLTFSFAKWSNAYGSKCGTIELVAMKTTDGQSWSVSKEDPYMEGAICTLTVKNAGDAITVTGTGDCVQMCGAGETIDTISFPLASKVERPATQAEIADLYQDTSICP